MLNFLAGYFFAFLVGVSICGLIKKETAFILMCGSLVIGWVLFISALVVKCNS